MSFTDIVYTVKPTQQQTAERERKVLPCLSEQQQAEKQHQRHTSI